ncbi:MAG: GTP pyrophosphokinase family protein [Bacilli bacterium]
MNNNLTIKELGGINIKDHIPDNAKLKELIEYTKQNAQKWKTLQTYYQCAMMEIETKFRVLDQEFSLQYDCNPIETIKTRIKGMESLAGKLVRKNLPMNIKSVEEHIFDMAGVRVICSFIEDIYKIADSFLSQDDVTLLEKRDYIKNPKPSGYRGLHLIVEVPIFLHNEKRMMKVEVQLRTIAMDFWASLEHKLRYKKDLSPELMEKLSQELTTCATQITSVDEKMQELKNIIDEYKEQTA